MNEKYFEAGKYKPDSFPDEEAKKKFKEPGKRQIYMQLKQTKQ